MPMTVAPPNRSTVSSSHASNFAGGCTMPVAFSVHGIRMLKTTMSGIGGVYPNLFRAAESGEIVGEPGGAAKIRCEPFGDVVDHAASHGVVGDAPLHEAAGCPDRIGAASAAEGARPARVID